MATTAKWYGKGVLHAVSDTIWTSDTIKVALTTVTYTPDQDAHEFFSSVTNEITGTGYTAGGVTLGSKTATYDATSNETRLDAADASWTSATITYRSAIIYKSTGVASTSPLLGYVTWDSDQSVSSGTASIVWDSTGVLKITAL